MRTVHALWNPAPRGLKPADSEVHVFSAPLDVPANRFDKLASWLSDDEWQRATRFHLVQDRRRFVAARGTLREILTTLLGIHPGSLAFSYGEFGKPRIAAPAAARSLHFNLAHSDSIAVYAVAKHALGVDVERIRNIDDADQITERFFSPLERLRLMALPAQQRAVAFFNCWTRKEAFLKAIGSGLHDRMHQIEISPGPGSAAKSLPITSESEAWALHSLLPAEEFVGALAVRQDDPRVNCWKWTWRA